MSSKEIAVIGAMPVGRLLSVLSATALGKRQANKICQETLAVPGDEVSQDYGFIIIQGQLEQLKMAVFDSV